MANASLLQQKVWLDKHIYDEAERVYYENLAQKESNSYESKSKSPSKPSKQSTVDPKASNIEEKIKETESKIKNLVTEFQEIKDLVKKFHDRLQSVESFISKYPISQQHGVPQPSGSSHQPSTSQNKNDDDDADDGVDLFGSDSEDDDEEAKKIKEQRLAMYAEKKSKKPALIAKSNIILDVKPWDDETNMKELETAVRSIQMDGLLWGASKLVPLAYGIHKLQISCVVEDDKVSVDLLQEAIEGFEDYLHFENHYLDIRRTLGGLPDSYCDGSSQKDAV